MRLSSRILVEFIPGPTTEIERGLVAEPLQQRPACGDLRTRSGFRRFNRCNRFAVAGHNKAPTLTNSLEYSGEVAIGLSCGDRFCTHFRQPLIVVIIPTLSFSVESKWKGTSNLGHGGTNLVVERPTRSLGFRRGWRLRHKDAWATARLSGRFPLIRERFGENSPAGRAQTPVRFTRS